MCREQSESEFSPALESEDGRLARTCGGALSLSRRVGTLCRLLFPITGVQPSFSCSAEMSMKLLVPLKVSTTVSTVAIAPPYTVLLSSMKLLVPLKVSTTVSIVAIVPPYTVLLSSMKLLVPLKVSTTVSIVAIAPPYRSAEFHEVVGSTEGKYNSVYCGNCTTIPFHEVVGSTEGKYNSVYCGNCTGMCKSRTAGSPGSPGSTKMCKNRPDNYEVPARAYVIDLVSGPAHLFLAFAVRENVVGLFLLTSSIPFWSSGLTFLRPSRTYKSHQGVLN